jgi:hypothetical protein
MRSITLTEGGFTCVVTEDPAQDLTIRGWECLIRQALVGVGFHPESVDDLFNEENAWITQKEDA